jgi:hypothetical protein
MFDTRDNNSCWFCSQTNRWNGPNIFQEAGDPSRGGWKAPAVWMSDTGRSTTQRHLVPQWSSGAGLWQTQSESLCYGCRVSWIASLWRNKIIHYFLFDGQFLRNLAKFVSTFVWSRVHIKIKFALRLLIEIWPLVSKTRRADRYDHFHFINFV